MQQTARPPALHPAPAPDGAAQEHRITNVFSTTAALTLWR